MFAGGGDPLVGLQRMEFGIEDQELRILQMSDALSEEISQRRTWPAHGQIGASLRLVMAKYVCPSGGLRVLTYTNVRQ